MTRITGTLHEGESAVMISRWIMLNVQTKVAEKIKIHISRSITFSPKSVPFMR